MGQCFFKQTLLKKLSKILITMDILSPLLSFSPRSVWKAYKRLKIVRKRIGERIRCNTSTNDHDIYIRIHLSVLNWLVVTTSRNKQ